MNEYEYVKFQNGAELRRYVTGRFTMWDRLQGERPVAFTGRAHASLEGLFESLVESAEPAED